MRFIWTEEYSVKVELLNDQHKHFFDIANRIEDATDRSDITKEDLDKLVSELGEYALFHLSEEEKYFKELNYPQVKAHTDVHNLFRNRVASYLMDINKPEIDIKKLAKEMAEFAGLWLFQHISTMDKAYSDFFNEHGLK